MERLHIVAVIALTFVVLGGLPVDSLLSRGSSRWKRQAVRVISNESLPCEQLELTLTQQNGGTPPRHIQLNDEDKKQLMRMRGFDFLPSLMAPSEHEAMQVADILQPTKLNVGHPIGFSTSRKETVKSGNSRSLSRSEILARIKAHRNVKRSASHAATAAPTNEDAAAAAAAAAEKLPYVLPEDIGINQTIAQYTSDGFTTTVDYCIVRTTQVQVVEGNQYLQMCTACATTTSSPPDVWPSFLYGAVCNVEDNSCLYEGTVSYGKCLPSGIPVTLLRKSSSSCVLVLENGQKVVSEDWLPFTYMLGIGCQCAVSEQSRFR